jgi:hypothetical protein
MNVNASNSAQQMQGSGNGQGNGGMRDVMQNLSQEDRTALKDKMSSLSQTDKQSMMSQMKQVDASSMSSQDYTKTLMDILDQSQANKTNTSNAYGFSTYA